MNILRHFLGQFSNCLNWRLGSSSDENNLVDDQDVDTAPEPEPAPPVREPPSPAVFPCQLIQCTICTEDLKSPIFQCRQGHLICRKYLAETKVCDTCGKKMPEPPFRNRALEEIIEAFSKYFGNPKTSIPNAVNMQGNYNSTLESLGGDCGAKIIQAHPLITVTPETHQYFACGGPDCTSHPLIGVHYRCFECPHYELCEKCVSSAIHDHHLLIRIPQPNLKFLADTYHRKCQVDA